MKFLSKATMPVTLEIDDDGTIATKSYVDAAVASVGGGLEDLGYFANDNELITHIIMNDLPSGLYTITLGYFAIPTLLALFKVSTAKYHASLFNGDSMTEVYVDYPNSIVEVFAYKTEINSIQSQLVGLADLLEGI